jgi:anti-anti-sigma factor
MATFEITPLEDRNGLRLIGELDLAAAPELGEALFFDVDQHGELCLELSELSFVDSVGVSTILAHARARNGDGPLVLANPSAAVARVFEILSLDEHPGIEVRGNGRSADLD